MLEAQLHSRETELWRWVAKLNWRIDSLPQVFWMLGAGSFYRVW